jgi:peptidoglycan/xylan/chitin deacetylase (PgdA/CDA1 family)
VHTATQVKPCLGVISLKSSPGVRSHFAFFGLGMAFLSSVFGDPRSAWLVEDGPTADPLQRSAVFQTAVSQIFNLQRVGMLQGPTRFLPSAECNSAIQQITNLRYAAAALAPAPASKPDYTLREGAIVRGATASRKLALVFTGHQFAEGGTVILDQLNRHKAKASFFLTGDFLANPEFQELVQRLVREGHYLGPHSDKHLLYFDWTPRRQLLVSRQEFLSDLEANLQKISGFGIKRTKVSYFLPPYEQHNQQIADWTKEAGLTLINYSPGTRSNADYTGETDKNFVDSKTIFDSILKRDRDGGLNGFLLLLHIGAGPGRSDKFHNRFRDLLGYLKEKGYALVRVDELLAP